MTDDFVFPHEEFILVGKVVKPHGLRGEVKIFAYSDDVETLQHYATFILVDKQGQLSPSLHVEKARIQGKTVVLKLRSINDRNSAEALQGMGVLVAKENLLEVDEGEYYWFQLYDLPVFTEDGVELGTITSVFSNGAQDIMVVQRGKDEFLIPVLESIIKEQTEKKVVISPPPGLLEINTRAGE